MKRQRNLNEFFDELASEEQKRYALSIQDNPERMLAYKQRVIISDFERLPTEIIVLIMYELSYDDLKSICQVSSKLNKVFKENTINIMEGKVFASGEIFYQDFQDEFPHSLGFRQMKFNFQNNETVIDIGSNSAEEWFYLTNCGNVYHQYNNPILSERNNLPLSERMNFKEKIIKIVSGVRTSFITNVGTVYINASKDWGLFGVQKLIYNEDENFSVYMTYIKFSEFIIDIVDFVFLTREGKCYKIYKSKYTEIELKKPVKKIAKSVDSWFFLCNDDTLYGVGANNTPQILFNNCQEIYSFPTRSFAIKKNGDLYVYGAGNHGALGDGDISDHIIRKWTKISFPFSILSIYSFNYTTFIMTRDFKVYVCGRKPDVVTGKVYDSGDDGNFKLVKCPPVTRIALAGYGVFYFTPPLEYSNRFKCVNCKINDATLQMTIASRLIYCSENCARSHWELPRGKKERIIFK